MRVYEIAREVGVTSAEAIRAASEAGLEVSSAISVVDGDDEAAFREALKGANRSDADARRAAKASRAAELAAAAVAEQRERLAAHLKVARDAAAGKRVSVAAAPVATAPQPAPAAEAPVSSPAKPQIRMAPGHKAKPLPSVSAAQTGLTSAGFKPLQRARPTATISISVAAPPKQRPPKPAAEFVDDFERGNRKGKKDREGQKSFDKRTQRVGAAAAAAAPAQPSSRISVDASKKEVSIRGAVVVKDFAAKLGIKPNRLIADLMGLKILASINQRIEPDVATKVAEKYGFKVTIEHARDKAAAKPVLKAIDADDLIPEDPPESLRPRAPVITFLGHVDHGKTTLMDWIRKEHVAQGEAGGITQQISAYQVEVAGKKITFLDTPGHAAFSAMRARGAQITDIAVLIIAADDGIMPQTEECIRVARQAGVQIMVAITKVDKPTSNVDRVKQQLQKAGLTPEEWGGDIICCPVSGVTGEGVDALLENILVQAEVL